MRLRIVLLALVAVLLTLPEAAPAALVYQKGVANSSVWIASDKGHNKRRLARNAALPRITPDGSAVAFVDTKNGLSLREVRTRGGKQRTLVERWQFSFIAISPDSRYIATLAGPASGRARLVLIDRRTRRTRTIARGFFSGASFAPTSELLVYARSPAQRTFPKTDLHVVAVTGGESVAITDDGRSLLPAWGPEKIAFARYARPKRRGDGPKYNIHTIDFFGRTEAVTDHKVPFLLTGLAPLAWSRKGDKLLAVFGGQDTIYPVTVDPRTGREKVVGRRRDSIVATSLSRDGRSILGFTGGLEGDPSASDVIVVPYGGGRKRVLVRRAFFPDWTR